MPQFTQANRPIQLTTPLGKDVLLAVALHGTESISTLYQFSIDCLAELAHVSSIKFDQMMGEPISLSLELPDKKKRYFSGICQRIGQSDSGSEFTRFHLQMVPTLWLLTKRTQSRIFQHKSIPDILKIVLAGLKVEFLLEGIFEQRDYCVQYRETDFNFVSRLMEEEGIYYYFKHDAGGETMMIGNTPGAHKELEPKATITFKNPQQNKAQSEEFIESLIKSQEIVSGQITLWDHCFELPHKHLEADKKTEKTVSIGKVSTNLAPPKVSSKLENYDWPGAYAQRFDGINKGGGDQPAQLQKIFVDNKRTVAIRADQEAVTALSVQGLSDCRHLASGYHFKVVSLSTDKSVVPFQADGQYLLTQVSHTIESDINFRSGPGEGFHYKNSFTCIPFSVPFRPQHVSPIPVIYGSQTAVVVGPAGEEIFTDKYGRVKVQFHWDRQGKNDADSSCWVRVGTMWAGRGWGMVHIPRIGQEVIVDFLEGDPDQPIIMGNVYNADQMPHYTLPDEKTKSYLKTNTSPGGNGFNEIRLEDKKGEEQIFIHGERNQDIRIKNDCMEAIMHDRHLIVGIEKDGKKTGKQHEEVMVDKHLKVHKDQEEHIGGNYKLHVGGEDNGPGNVDIIIDGTKKELISGESHLHVKKKFTSTYDDKIGIHSKNSSFRTVDGNDQLHVLKSMFHQVDGEKGDHVKGKLAQAVDSDYGLTVGGRYDQKVTSGFFLESAANISIKASGSIVLDAGMQLSLKVGGNFVDISPAGIAINGTTVLINSGGAAGSAEAANPSTPKAPNDPKEAQDAAEAKPIKPTKADDAKTGRKSCN